jgi:hypothetical protein
VTRAPNDKSLRLAYAGALLAVGRRAAAWHEVLVAAQHGGEVPDDLRARFRLESPPGTVWTLAPLETSPEAVAPPDVPDARYPGVAALSGERRLPLLVLLGRPCGECDESGETPCTDCGGKGWKPSLLGDDEVPCPERDTCLRCAGTRYVVNTARASRGDCPHPDLASEAKGSTWELERCRACGLGLLSSFPRWTRLPACAGCGRLDCACREAER